MVEAPDVKRGSSQRRTPWHPPLVKLLATIPLLGMSLDVPPLLDRYFKHEAFLGGRDFVYGNHRA